MMQSFLLICCGLFFSNLTAQVPHDVKTVEVVNGPKMEFETRFIDIGAVKKGEKRETFFEFTNTGNEDLVIDLISACECTTTDYPIKAIKPGEKGRIDVVFDSTEKDESETIDIDIYLANEDPKTGGPVLEIIQYKFELLK